jgi:bacterioferritin
MKKAKLISMLNRDFAEEHAAIIRYLTHGWLEGEGTSLGASLISRSREEMWHMHWLGMIICQLGGEPDFTPAPYPYDPTNRKTIFQSYVSYEERLIPHYNGEADMVDDPHIKRVLQREAWESAIHAKKFLRIIKKLSPKQARGLPGAERTLPRNFLELLQEEVTDKYQTMLQNIRYSWTLQDKGTLGWQLMDHAMENMKQVAHFAEDIAENGVPPQFRPGKIDKNKNAHKAVSKVVKDLTAAHKHHMGLKKNRELQKHGGLVVNLDLTVQQEEYQAHAFRDRMKK